MFHRFRQILEPFYKNSPVVQPSVNTDVNVLVKIKWTTVECYRISEIKIKMSKTIRVAPVKAGSKEILTEESKNVIDHEKTLKILKLVCVGVVILTVANASAFAGIISPIR